jgi:hypothetical protein
MASSEEPERLRLLVTQNLDVPLEGGLGKPSEHYTLSFVESDLGLC